MEHRVVEHLPITELKPSQHNARTHSERQIRQLVASIKRFGFTSPVLIGNEGNVVAGHARLEASKRAGLTHVPCIRLSGLTPADWRAYMIADNKLALNSEWDLELLASEVESLMVSEYDVSVIGFEQPEIDVLLSDAADASTRKIGPEDAHPALPDVTCSQVGDVWQCGRHRIICGDVKNHEVVSKLMGNDRADMIFTDAPYNVKIQGNVSGLGRVQHREFAEASGEMSPAEFEAFLRSCFEALEGVSRNGAIAFTCMDWRHLTEILNAGSSVFSELKNMCVWAKTNAGMGTFYRSQHELVLVWKIGDAPHVNNFGLGDKGRYRTNLWTYAGVNSFRSGREEELGLHPTVKPVALVADAIRDVSDRNDIVLDGFGGSGTTMVAAQKTGRRARLIEIDPAYCDVTVLRWQRQTGQQAVLDGDGRTFGEVAAERNVAACQEQAA